MSLEHPSFYINGIGRCSVDGQELDHEDIIKSSFKRYYDWKRLIFFFGRLKVEKRKRKCNKV
jgi:hypothetical protein